MEESHAKSGHYDWMEPGAFLIRDGVHRVPLPLPNDGLRAVNIYVIESDDGLVLIDSGWALPTSETALSTALASIGYGLRDIKKFFVTHMHSDHYTQAIALRASYGAEVYLGIGEKKSIELLQDRLANGGHPSEFPALVTAGAEHLAHELVSQDLFANAELALWTDPDHWLSSDDIFDVGGRNLRVIPTPGHTQGHVVFHDESMGLLYAGDHVLPSITPSIGFEPVRANLALRSYLESLTTMLNMDDCVLLPAHGAPGESVHQRVRELMAHHTFRLEEMGDSVNESSSALDVAQRVTWTSRKRGFDELNLLNKILAVLETDSHLRLLASEGKLICGRRGDVDYYTQPTPKNADSPTALLV